MAEEKKAVKAEEKVEEVTTTEAVKAEDQATAGSTKGDDDDTTTTAQKDEDKKEATKKKKAAPKVNPNLEAAVRDLTSVSLDHIPENLRAGDEIIVHSKIKEGNKERIQLFKGLVIKVAGHGVYRTITVRKVSNGVGVERIFVLASPAIVKIELKESYKVRRANIGYIRELTGKAARLKPRVKKVV